MEKLILITALLTCNLSLTNDIYCKVVGITDGDTIKCLTDNKKQIKVRLYKIDAPESNQAFGSKSKQALSNMIFGKQVKIVSHGNDKYRRLLDTIYFGNKDINLEMIDQGMAWYYPFSKKSEQYKQAEARARNKKIALWADKNPLAPWDFKE